MSVTLETRYAEGFIRPHEFDAMQQQVIAAHDVLHSGSGLGSDFLGWMDLPVNYDKEEFARIKAAAARIRQDTDIFIAIGIGGSYLGARAAIEFLKSPLYNVKKKDTPDVYFAGNSISSTALAELLELCEGRRVSINVISKSGTTTEPAIAFRVLTAVGLLPIAVAGCDIDALMAGAAKAREELRDPDLHKNDCYRYAAARSILLRKGRAVELMVSYEPQLAMMSEWWKQLYGESEGKDGKGLFPASVVFSTDLHSLGQFVQDGSNILFETVMLLDQAPREMTIEEDPENVDGLNFLTGRTMAEINRKAFEGTVLAHADGGTPSLVVRIPAATEENLGYLIYFFEKACAVSGYMLGVNPFDQPGVESYKRNMFALLGKPGYEAEREALEKRLGR